MKINFKGLRKLLTNSFILVTAITFISCTPVNSSKSDDAILPTNEIIKTVDVQQPKYIKTSHEDSIIEVVTTTKPPYSFIDDNVDTSSIINATEYFLDNVEELLSLSDLTDQQQILAMYAYRKLITANILPEIFELELNNMMIEQVLPRCMSDEEWQKNFGVLNKTLDEQECLGDTYGTIAWLIHKDFCVEEHSYDNSSIKCKILTQQFNDKYSE